MICAFRQHSSDGECSGKRTVVEIEAPTDIIIGVLTGMTPVCTSHFETFKRDYLGRVLTAIEVENAIREAEDG